MNGDKDFHLATGFHDFDRQAQLDALRTKTITAALRLVAAHHEDPMISNDNERDKFDLAVLKLAAKLSEPEQCPTCSQEVKR